MRKLLNIIEAQPSTDGDGVKIHRLAGKHLNAYLNPFILLDEINSDDAADYIGGFPEHPHRGFETITYMKAGRMRHRDHMGNEGIIGAGDVQWMTAGSGVYHSEMPEQEKGLLHGFQIWLNLPAREKMQPADYQEIDRKSIPKQSLEQGGEAKIIAGKVIINQCQNIIGPLTQRSTQPVMLDVRLKPDEAINIEFSHDNPALVYIYHGDTIDLKRRQLGVFSNGSTLQLKAQAKGTEMLILSGLPINEPIVQYGPFVMNTRAEIEQALQDLNNGTLVSRT